MALQHLVTDTEEEHKWSNRLFQMDPVHHALPILEERLKQHPLIVWTDQKNLVYFQMTKHLNACQAVWALFFARFNFTISYNLHDTDIIVPPSCMAGALTWEIESLVSGMSQTLELDLPTAFCAH